MALPKTVSSFLRSPNPATFGALANTINNKRRSMGRRAGKARGPKLNRVPEGPAPAAEVVVYFAEDRRKMYQLEQWLPVFEELHRRHPVVIVMRSRASFNNLSERTPLPTVYTRRLADVLELYDELDPKVAIYVNNGVANFQSLAVASILHVHVNHGESDKVSMVSNQAKAYDRVFVAGEAAERRHAAALINFDPARLVRTGRPQLDLKFEPVLPPSARHTVIYAPTWEGENDFNNYTSVDRYGVAIVRQLLARDDVRVVYRPHPRVASSTTLEVVGAHQEILSLIEQADPAGGHATAMEGSILALFQECDAMVTDVSSVGLDFLYLRNDAPLFITDRRDDPAQLAVDAPISGASDVIDSTSIGRFGEVLAARLAEDSRMDERIAMRRFYFGDIAPGESTQRFLDAVSEVAATRDAMIARLPHRQTHASAAAAASGDAVGDVTPQEAAEVQNETPTVDESVAQQRPDLVAGH
ncbi:glycosyl transferase [Kineosporia sp. NBRC 101677]|uniref:CDP-glycerol glycerophosphotransferase family protein n=1 Tax=Kineosporia sp. NBRC 101677 TaxID=3032197 RepID=UPI0024A43E8E|nr:CDP-glycerol glycerophosphotransferase family protein [Kineosporia sp. NBRC 101677]GLY14687.1 glycosyl transferase [Kineosporia sp. NBRC 101677]